jgi:hypothetical protein
MSRAEIIGEILMVDSNVFCLDKGCQNYATELVGGILLLCKKCFNKRQKSFDKEELDRILKDYNPPRSGRLSLGRGLID